MKITQRLALWARRLALWAETGAKVWAAHWLLIVGSFFVLGSTLLKWVEFPLSRNLSGLKLPLFRNVGMFPHVYVFSFGVLGIAVLITGLVLLRRFGLHLALAVAAAILITLWIVVPGQIAFQQPALLRRLTDEDQEIPVIRAFTSDYLPRNLGSAEEIPKQLILYTDWGRFLAAYSFLELGWYCFGLGSLLIAAYSIIHLRGEWVVTGMLLICLPLGALLITSVPSLIGQHYFAGASIAKAQGENERAITYYRRAMQWDRWHAQNIDTYATIGELEKQAGVADGSPERHISRAVEFRTADDYEHAIFEFDQAAEAGGALAEVARRESVRTRADLGVALYRVGSIGDAVSNWEQAFAEDPSQLQVLPYLARGNYDIGRYQAALDVVARSVRIVGDHTSMLADAYSIGGDCYAKLGQEADARRYYDRSITIDWILNHWALTGLVGE